MRGEEKGEGRWGGGGAGGEAGVRELEVAVEEEGSSGEEQLRAREEDGCVR